MRSPVALILVPAMVLGFVVGAASGALPEQFQVWGEHVKTPAVQGNLVGDPSPDLRLQAAIQLDDAEKARGLAVLQVMAGAPPQSDTAPEALKRATTLEAHDCPGQYGPLTLAVIPAADTELAVAVTDLMGPGGRKIGAEHFDVRVALYGGLKSAGPAATIPLALEISRPGGICPAGALRTFWITYHVPEDAAAGVYEGEVWILAGGRERLALPLRLEVYPFKLAEPNVDLYIYYNNSTKAEDLQAVEKQLADQRCHGMNAATLEVPVTAGGDVSSEAVTPWFDLYAKIGFARKRVFVGLYNRIIAEWLNTPDKAIQMWSPWFRYYPFSDRLDRRYVKTVKMLHDEARRRGLELIVSVADEPGSHPWTTEAAQHYNDLLKAQAPDVLREMSVGGGWAMGRPEEELWKGRLSIWTTNRWLANKLDLVRKDDAKVAIQIYNMAGGGWALDGIESARAMYGVFAWRTRAAGAAQWTYYHGATPGENYTLLPEDAAQGNVPTPRWEMVREGAKDRRYLATLEARLEGKTSPAADEARRLLAEIAGHIPLKNEEKPAPGCGSVPVPPPGTLDQWRARVAESITKLP